MWIFPSASSEYPGQSAWISCRLPALKSPVHIKASLKLLPLPSSGGLETSSVEGSASASSCLFLSLLHLFASSHPLWPLQSQGSRVGEIGDKAEPFPELVRLLPLGCHESSTKAGLFVGGTLVVLYRCPPPLLVPSGTSTGTFSLVPSPMTSVTPALPPSSCPSLLSCPPIILCSVLSGGTWLPSELSF